MTLGEHLDELRSRLLRAVLAVAVGMVLCYAFGGHLLKVMLWPLAVATAGNPPKLKYFSPSEGFTVYLRVALVAGAVLASPYALRQMWMFIAAGLYERERRTVRRLLAPSVALFLLGVAFFMVIVAPLGMRFFMNFARTHYPEPPQWGVEFFSRFLIGDNPVLPATAPAAGTGSLEPELRIGYYISFVTTLALVFGLSFQTPLVVLFLGRSGLVPVSTMRRFRWYVFLVILIIAAIVTPADVASMIALAGPMYLLYEIGLLFAARGGRRAEP